MAGHNSLYKSTLNSNRIQATLFIWTVVNMPSRYQFKNFPSYISYHKEPMLSTYANTSPYSWVSQTTFGLSFSLQTYPQLYALSWATVFAEFACPRMFHETKNHFFGVPSHERDYARWTLLPRANLFANIDIFGSTYFLCTYFVIVFFFSFL